MIKILNFIIVLPLALLVIAFAVVNRESVTVDLLGMGYEMTAPLFVLMLLPFVFGFLLGGAMSWITHGRYRRETRQLRRENKKLRQECSSLKKDSEQNKNIIDVPTQEFSSLKIVPSAPPKQS